MTILFIPDILYMESILTKALYKDNILWNQFTFYVKTTMIKEYALNLAVRHICVLQKNFFKRKCQLLK